MRRQDAERGNGLAAALLRDLATKLSFPVFFKISLVQLNDFDRINLLIEPHLVFILLSILCWSLLIFLIVKLPGAHLVGLIGSLLLKDLFKISYWGLRSHWRNVLLASVSFLGASRVHWILLLDLL